MENRIDTIDDTLGSLDNLKKLLIKKKVLFVSSSSEVNLVKATAYAWLRTSRCKFDGLPKVLDISIIDDYYCNLLSLSDKRAKRSAYKTLIAKLRNALISFRSELIKITVSDEVIVGVSEMPDFSTLISSAEMIAILERRWKEIEKCIKCEAPLSATVMMGGLLESILITVVNTIKDKTSLFQQKATPLISGTKKPKPLAEWMLKDYIDVFCQIKILSSPTAEISRVIRDYRNYIHPEKELRAGESIDMEDAKLFWATTTSLISQILSRHIRNNTKI